MVLVGKNEMRDGKVKLKDIRAKPGRGCSEEGFCSGSEAETRQVTNP